MAVKMSARQVAALTGVTPPRTRRAAPTGPRKVSASEAAFDTIWARLGPSWAPAPVGELVFAPPRKWRFDRAWPAPYFVAVEIDGGTWSGGRHTRGAGFAKDCEKMNRAAVLGWVVLRYTTDMLTQDPDVMIGQIVTLLRARSAMLITAD